MIHKIKLLRNEELEVTESMIEELDPGIELIKQAATKLECSVEVMSRAMMFYHLFCRSLDAHYDRYVLVPAILNLTMKLHGKPVDSRTMLILFYNLKGKKPDVLSDEFSALMKSISRIEIFALKVLESSTNIEIAHQYLAYFVEDLCTMIEVRNVWTAFSTLLMRIISDFYTSKKSVNYQASHIAITSILVALYQCGVSLNHNGNWIKACDASITNSELSDIMEDIFYICDVSVSEDIKERLKALK